VGKPEGINPFLRSGLDKIINMAIKSTGEQGRLEGGVDRLRLVQE